MKRFLAYTPGLLMAAVVVVASVEPASAQNFDSLRLDFFQGSFGSVFRTILNFFLLIAGLAAFFFIVYGGFVYLTAGGDAAKATQGRTYIVNAVIGVVIIAASFALARYITGFTNTGNDRIF